MQELETVIQRASVGDREAFGDLVHRFQDMAVGYAFSVLGDFHLAEDAAQEAFVEVFRDLHQLREPHAFASWFRRIVFKQCDRITRGKRLDIQPLDAVAEFLKGDTDIFAELEEKEMQDQVKGAIAQLPEHERQTVALFYISDYSQKEISEFLGVPVSTVKKRLYDARKRLKGKVMPMIENDLKTARPSKDAQFVERVLEVSVPDEKEHSEEIYDLSGWRARLEHGPVDWQTSRIGLIDNQMVTVQCVSHLTMRVGIARVKVASFGFHYTHPAHRDKNETLQIQTSQAALKAMHDHGYGMSVSMYGRSIQEKLGYVPVAKGTEMFVRVDDLPGDPDFEVAEFTPEESKFCDMMAELNNRDHETVTGTMVRPTYLQGKEPGGFKGVYWKDSEGAPSGYVLFSESSGTKFGDGMAFAKDLDEARLSEAIRDWFEQNRGHVASVTTLSDQAACFVQEADERWLVFGSDPHRDYRPYRVWRDGEQLYIRPFVPGVPFNLLVDDAAGDPDQILQVVAQIARRFGNELVRFDRLPYKSPLGVRVRALGSCRIESKRQQPKRRTGCSHLGRIVNLAALFEQLKPELVRRLSESLMHWTGNLVISTGEEQIMLQIDGNDVSVVSDGDSEHAIRGGQEVAQLVFGMESPDEVIDTNGIKVAGDARQLCRVLFPAQYPQLRNQDL